MSDSEGDSEVLGRPIFAGTGHHLACIHGVNTLYGACPDCATLRFHQAIYDKLSATLAELSATIRASRVSESAT